MKICTNNENISLIRKVEKQKSYSKIFQRIRLMNIDLMVTLVEIGFSKQLKY